MLPSHTHKHAHTHTSTNSSRKSRSQKLLLTTVLLRVRVFFFILSLLLSISRYDSHSPEKKLLLYSPSLFLNPHRTSFSPTFPSLFLLRSFLSFFIVLYRYISRFSFLFFLPFIFFFLSKPHGDCTSNFLSFFSYEIEEGRRQR